MIKLLSRKPTALRLVNPSAAKIKIFTRSEERFSRNAETDLVCRLLLEKKNPEEQVALAEAGRDPRADLPEQLVARSVPEGIVDLLEVVEVDEQKGETF